MWGRRNISQKSCVPKWRQALDKRILDKFARLGTLVVLSFLILALDRIKEE